MRTVQWLLVVSAALFISGIGFVTASGRSARAASPVAEVLVTTPVASIKQIMNGIVMPDTWRSRAGRRFAWRTQPAGNSGQGATAFPASTATLALKNL